MERVDGRNGDCGSGSNDVQSRNFVDDFTFELLGGAIILANRPKAAANDP